MLDLVELVPQVKTVVISSILSIDFNANTAAHINRCNPFPFALSERSLDEFCRRCAANNGGSMDVALLFCAYYHVER